MAIFSRQQLDGLTGSGKGGSVGATGARQKPRQGFGSGGGMSLLGDPKQQQQQQRQQQQHQQNLKQWQKLSQTRTQPIVPQGNTVDEMLKSLQKHPLYNDQNDRRLFHHVSNEYKRAYPGDVQYDEFGKMQRPKPAIQPEQISPFDPDGVLGESKSRTQAAQTARSFSAVTGLINEIDQAGHPERRETTQLQDLGQNLAQSIANIPHNQKMLREGRPEDRKTNPVQVLMGAATGAVGKAAGRFAKGQGASPLLVGLADKGASMAAGMVPGLVGSAAGAIGDAFAGDSGGSAQSGQAQLPSKPSASMPHADAPSDTMIGWGTGNTAQSPTWSLNKDVHRVHDRDIQKQMYQAHRVPEYPSDSGMYSFLEDQDFLHGSDDILNIQKSVAQEKHSSSEFQKNIDWDFLKNREETRKDIYFPGDPQIFSKSGATVATGVDLGQMNQTELESLVRNHGLNPDTAKKLEPYLGLKGSKAKAYIDANEVELNNAEVQNLDMAKHSEHYDKLARKFNASQARVNSDIKFEDLPKNAKTAVYSLATQYGTNLDRATPRFWKAFTKQDWQAVHDELMNFGDDYPSRREMEALQLRPLLRHQ